MTATPKNWKEGITKLEGSQASFRFYAQWCSVYAMRNAIVHGNYDSFGQLYRKLNRIADRNQLVQWAGDMSNGVVHFTIKKGELDTVRKSTRDGVDEIIASMVTEDGSAFTDEVEAAISETMMLDWKAPKAEGTRKFYAEEIKARILGVIKRYSNDSKYEAHRPEDGEFLVSMGNELEEIFKTLATPATPATK